MRGLMFVKEEIENYWGAIRNRLFLVEETGIFLDVCVRDKFEIYPNRDEYCYRPVFINIVLIPVGESVANSALFGVRKIPSVPRECQR
jgi:hypothetical protein